MGYLFWPGDHRADEHFTDQTFREAMLAVEMVWLDVLVEAGIAPPDARADLSGLVEDYHEEWLVEETEAGGNPAMALVGLLRSALEDEQPTAAAWLHRGLTSQDVVDTALMLMAQDAVAQLQVDMRGQAERLAMLASTHKGTPMVARTLTQHAVPDDVRAQGRPVAGRRPGRLRRAQPPRLPGPDRRRRGHPRGGGRAGRQPAGDRGPGRPAARPRAGRALAHASYADHAARRRAGPLHRRLGPDRGGRADPEPSGDRRAQRGHRRRLVDDAAEAQPGPVGAGPPGRDDHADARRDPAPRRRAAERRAGRRRLARRVGDPARPRAPHDRRRLADLRPGGGPRGRPRPDGGDAAQRPRVGRRRAVVDGRAGRQGARRSPTSASPPSSSTPSSSAPG